MRNCECSIIGRAVVINGTLGLQWLSADVTELDVTHLDMTQPGIPFAVEAMEQNATAEPKSAMEGSENGWMVQDEMDVDAMDKAYKAYKKNKRQQKKLKAKKDRRRDPNDTD